MTFKKEGYLKRVVKAPVSSHQQETVTGKLEPSKKYLLLQQAIERSQTAFGAERAVDAMVELQSFLFVDQVIFVKLDKYDKSIEMDAALYDLRSRRRLARVRQVVQKDHEAESTADILYVNVPYDGRLVEPAPEKPPEQKRRRPFYAQWWFWTAVGAAATAAIVIPLETLPEDRSTPGYRPTTITFPQP